jgi:hypothetical protein
MASRDEYWDPSSDGSLPDLHEPEVRFEQIGDEIVEYFADGDAAHPDDGRMPIAEGAERTRGVQRLRRGEP